MELEVKVYGETKKVEKDVIIDEVCKYYDATGVMHFYMEVEEMDDEELIALYENSFACEE